MKYSEALEFINKILILHQRARSIERESLANMGSSPKTTEAVLENLAPLEKYVIPTILKMQEINDRGSKFEPISFYNLIYILDIHCQGTLLLASMQDVHIPMFSTRLLQPWEPEDI